jgi:hypothetical protein
VKVTTEEKPDVTIKLGDIGRKIGEYKDVVVKELKDMEVEVKCWEVNIAKSEEEYTLEVDIKIAVRPKEDVSTK